MTEQFQTASGARVIINMADFEDAMNLHDSVLMEASALKLDVDFSFLKSFESIKDVDVTEILPVLLKDVAPALMRLAASKTVKDNLFACLTRSTYQAGGGRVAEKITRTTFNDAGARGDYYEIVLACLKVNLSPFFAPLLLRLSLAKTLTSPVIPK